MWFMTRHFSLVVEAGLDQVEYSADAAPGGLLSAAAGTTGRLLKSTVGVVWRPEAKFLSAPQLRLFVTHGDWNHAANQAGLNAAGVQTLANGTFEGRTSGTKLWRPGGTVVVNLFRQGNEGGDLNIKLNKIDLNHH
jgi:maltoporin